MKVVMYYSLHFHHLPEVCLQKVTSEYTPYGPTDYLGFADQRLRLLLYSFWSLRCWFHLTTFALFMQRTDWWFPFRLSLSTRNLINEYVCVPLTCVWFPIIPLSTETERKRIDPWLQHKKSKKSVFMIIDFSFFFFPSLCFPPSALHTSAAAGN